MIMITAWGTKATARAPSVGKSYDVPMTRLLIRIFFSPLRTGVCENENRDEVSTCVRRVFFFFFSRHFFARYFYTVRDVRTRDTGGPQIRFGRFTRAVRELKKEKKYAQTRSFFFNHWRPSFTSRLTGTNAFSYIFVHAKNSREKNGRRHQNVRKRRAHPLGV